MENLKEMENPIRTRRIKSNKLKGDHGIVMEVVGEIFTDTEKAIVDKGGKLWKGTTREEGLSTLFLKGVSPEFGKELEALVASATNMKSFDGVVRKQAKEPVKEPAKEVPKIQDNKLEKKPEKAPEEKVENKLEEQIEKKPKEESAEKPEVKLSPNILKSDFQGRDIIAERKGELITVTFDSKEIAKGTMTPKGPDVKLDKTFKAGFLFAKTPEEQAFERILPLIKTFK